jgi:lipopolysaccharide biosynthesis protein
MSGDTIKLLAFYLPQFHPIPENDRWWGKGFTEWTNVTKALPLFEGHYQPHLPSDLGFYDLRLRESRQEQIKYAKKYGIYGFCYHYYWFSGKKILNKPLDDMMVDNESDMPFCLCWANENWTRRWDGAEHKVLIEQKYLPDDDINFIKDAENYIKDSRYIRISGAPILIVYMPQCMPNANKAVKVWRNYCKTNGIGDIHLVAALTHGNYDYEKYGFDAGVEFPPHNMNVDNINTCINFYKPYYGCVYNYDDFAQHLLDKRYGPDCNVYRTVCPSWDNTARTGSRAVILLDGTPDNYEYWLSESISQTKREFPNEERFVFINAWNEWAEGCHLEPDRRYGLAFLEATERVVNGNTRIDKFSHTQLAESSRWDASLVAEIGNLLLRRISRHTGNLKIWVKQRPRLKRTLHKFIKIINR